MNIIKNFTLIILSLLLSTNCQNRKSVKFENDDANEDLSIIRKKKSVSEDIKFTKVDLELSRINHNRNQKKIYEIIDKVPHIHLSIAAGAAGIFSPQFELVNKDTQ